MIKNRTKFERFPPRFQIETLSLFTSVFSHVISVFFFAVIYGVLGFRGGAQPPAGNIEHYTQQALIQTNLTNLHKTKQLNHFLRKRNQTKKIFILT